MRNTNYIQGLLKSDVNDNITMNRKWKIKKVSSLKLDTLPGNVLLSHTVTHAVPLTL